MDDDEIGAAHEPLSCVGEHFPASWFGPTDGASYAPCELTRLRAEVYALREMEAALRVSLRDAMRLLDEMRGTAPKPSPAVFRAIGAKPVAFGMISNLGIR